MQIPLGDIINGVEKIRTKNLFQERGGPRGPGTMQFLAVTYSKMGEMAKAELTLKLADTMTPGDYNWEAWFLSAFKDPTLPHKVLDEIETIRKGDSASH